MAVTSINDTIAPTILDIQLPTAIDLFDYVNFTMTMRITDNASGTQPQLLEIEFESYRKSCEGIVLNYGLGNRVSGNKFDGIYNFSVAGLPFCKTGNHTIRSIRVFDKHGNVRFYDNSTLHSLGLQRWIFVNTTEDHIPPIVNDFSIEPSDSSVCYYFYFIYNNKFNFFYLV